MKTLYFDCSCGISGNMTLGALLEIIEDTDYLINELKKLNINGYEIQISKKVKNGIRGTYIDVILDKEYHQENRNLNCINKIIDDSKIDEKSKKLAKRIFKRVAEAESKVHDKPLDEVYFHETGAIDSIVDIVGTALLINKINPERIVSSVVNDGYGFIKCSHGIIPVPVPATSEIFSKSNVKYKQIDIDTELVTPTGAAIISEISTEFTTQPTMTVKKIGWGIGYKDLKVPNVLKVLLGECEQIIK